ncbi:hypothetical protein CRUP_007264, partial [Coryphaenoides rupestris]
MSLRLSALFEEHVGSILDDYRAIHGLTDKRSRQGRDRQATPGRPGADRQTRHATAAAAAATATASATASTADRQTRHAMKRRRRRSESPASSTASSPERKRRVSSRTSGRREPSPGVTPPPSSSSASSSSRPASLRQATPLRTPPLVNGRTDAGGGAHTPGRTRSSLRHPPHSPPPSSHS